MLYKEVLEIKELQRELSWLRTNYPEKVRLIECAVNRLKELNSVKENENAVRLS